MLKGIKIVLGVCGSIAAYKAAFLIRLLVKEGAAVKVVMTSSARDFITPLTFSTLSKNPVLGTFHDDKTGVWESHVELGMWADLILIAPASANTIGKMANGICDNLLLATYLSARCPVLIAPAMDLDMYQHPSTISNLQKLQSYGNVMIQAEYGELASGLIGEGRMAEPETLVAAIKSILKKKANHKGTKVLITAGPTYESIDPVRFIGNHSTGKMGYALAEEFASQGAEVFLVSGPTKIKVKNPAIHEFRVTTAAEMYEICKKLYKKIHVGIFSAAVSDYRMLDVSKEKIKKSGETLDLKLIKNPDIAFEMGKMKKPGQYNIGFALETENEFENASLKLKKKNFDFIVLNSLKEKGAGFAFDTNKIIIIDKYNDKKEFELKTKKEVASDIINYLQFIKNHE